MDAKQTSIKPAGNSITLTDNYFQAGSKVGSDQLACFVTGPGARGLCTGSNLLPQGEITSIGSVLLPPPTNRTTTVVIVGGTGAYVNARGTIDILPTSSTESTITFHISS